MDKTELEKRTKLFALQVIRFVTALPRNKASNVMGYQLLKSGTSIGANYREANRAASRNDFIHKISLVEDVDFFDVEIYRLWGAVCWRERNYKYERAIETERRPDIDGYSFVG